ncbi:NusG domain II-containing protein [Petroclostridium sp. X23]|uniref:NusG domain II-containing protein n=1 Tax=Petroclostridium sp. X23 TaxID=3045146 RepID=UPI0024AC9029|nr:NusG domain II-containing protein [Petroclostridium sp. X23]WHH59998.1 NusG domain II-containing protein [Petroclostridium sp. X23]
MATFYDKLIIAVILAGSLIAYGAIGVYSSEVSYDRINVKQGDKQVLEVVLGLKSDGIYPFKFEGGEGKIEVKGNKVRMLPMDKKTCPRSLCSSTGWIDQAYQSIVCLPNRLQVQFEGIEDSKVDIMVF